MSSDKQEETKSVEAPAGPPDMPVEVVVQKSNPVQRVRKAQPTGRNGRVACAGGCGTRVLKALGECRKCKKARLCNGLKHILKMKKVPA